MVSHTCWEMLVGLYKHIGELDKMCLFKSRCLPSISSLGLDSYNHQWIDSSILWTVYIYIYFNGELQFSQAVSPYTLSKLTLIHKEILELTLPQLKDYFNFLISSASVAMPNFISLSQLVHGPLCNWCKWLNRVVFLSAALQAWLHNSVMLRLLVRDY